MFGFKALIRPFLESNVLFEKSQEVEKMSFNDPPLTTPTTHTSATYGI
jgi:hypothetical protein